MYGKTIEDYLNGYKKKTLITGTLDLYKLGITYDEWKESDHPRDDEGKFSSTGGGSETQNNVNKENETPLSFSNGEEGSDFFKNDENYKEWDKALNKEELEAITNYTNEDYIPINTSLRTGITENTAKTNENIKHLDSMIEKFELSKPITVYRSISADVEKQIKKTFEDKAFSSATLDKDMVIDDPDHSSNIVLAINVPKGKGFGAFIHEHSYYTEEYEFLLKRNSKFKVKSKTKENGRTIIKLDLIKD